MLEGKAEVERQFIGAGLRVVSTSYYRRNCSRILIGFNLEGNVPAQPNRRKLRGISLVDFALASLTPSSHQNLPSLCRYAYYCQNLV
jgi:hypothetical protein